MMNSTTIEAAIAAINEIANAAIKAIEVIMAETTTAPAETATTETTTPAETTATEATTEKSHLDRFLDSWSKAPTAGELKEMIDQDPCPCDPMNDPAKIVVLDDDDSIIAVGSKTTGDLPCPTEATAAETDEAEESVPAEETTAADAEDDEAESKEIDLNSVYSILKYALHKEGRNEESDKSPYAPKQNITALVGRCCKVYLSKTDAEAKVIVKHNDYASAIITRAIDKHGNIKMFENSTICITESVKADLDLRRFLGIFDDIKDLIVNK